MTTLFAAAFAGLGVRGVFHAKVMHIWSRALVAVMWRYMLLAIFNCANEVSNWISVWFETEHHI
jgi:hypothetical protein